MDRRHPQNRIANTARGDDSRPIVGMVGDSTVRDAQLENRRFWESLAPGSPSEPAEEPVPERSQSPIPGGAKSRLQALQDRLSAASSGLPQHTAESALACASTVYRWDGSVFINRGTGTRRTVGQIAFMYGVPLRALEQLLMERDAGPPISSSLRIVR